MSAQELLTVTAQDGSAVGHDPKLSPEGLLHCYRTMLLVRAFDDVCLKLQRSGRIGFSIPNKGVEACQVGAASALRRPTGSSRATATSAWRCTTASRPWR
jgi:TPP-dependent pyruvate/acetoin dehydrogenase alpha subunit